MNRACPYQVRDDASRELQVTLLRVDKRDIASACMSASICSIRRFISPTTVGTCPEVRARTKVTELYDPPDT